MSSGTDLQLNFKKSWVYLVFSVFLVFQFIDISKSYDPYDHVTFVSVLKFLLEVTPPEHGCILRYPGEGSLVVVPLHVKAIVLKPPVVRVPDVPVPK